MQALIHQANLCGLTIPIRRSGAVPGQPVELRLEDDQAVAAFITRPSRFLFGIGKPRRLHLGYLDPEAAKSIMSAIRRNATLRVRIVEIEPAHARVDGTDAISISIWGAPEDLGPVVLPQ